MHQLRPAPCVLSPLPCVRWQQNTFSWIDASNLNQAAASQKAVTQEREALERQRVTLRRKNANLLKL